MIKKIKHYWRVKKNEKKNKEKKDQKRKKG